jgi:hypothetical protein
LPCFPHPPHGPATPPDADLPPAAAPAACPAAAAALPVTARALRRSAAAWCRYRSAALGAPGCGQPSSTTPCLHRYQAAAQADSALQHSRQLRLAHRLRHSVSQMQTPFILATPAAVLARRRAALQHNRQHAHLRPSSSRPPSGLLGHCRTWSVTSCLLKPKGARYFCALTTQASLAERCSSCGACSCAAGI